MRKNTIGGELCTPSKRDVHTMKTIHSFGNGAGVYKIPGTTPLSEIEGISPRILLTLPVFKSEAPMSTREAKKLLHGAERRIQSDARKAYDINKYIDVSTGKDSGFWRGHLGDAGDFVGIYKNTIEARNRPVHNYVVVHASVPKEAAALKASLGGEATLKDYMDSPQYKMLEQYATRNAKKLAFDFCAEMRLKCSTTVDAYTMREGYMLAIPDALWNLSTFDPCTDDNAYTHYRNCAHVEHNMNTPTFAQKSIVVTQVRVPKEFRRRVLAQEVYCQEGTAHQFYIYVPEDRRRLKLCVREGYYKNHVSDVKCLVQDSRIQID